MSIKTVWARIVALFSGGTVAHVLADWSEKATQDYDEIVDYAHSLRVEAEQAIGKIAVHELEQVEALIAAAKRRAEALATVGVIPEAHTQRLGVALSTVGVQATPVTAKAA
jgi:hypothetical protein